MLLKLKFEIIISSDCMPAVHTLYPVCFLGTLFIISSEHSVNNTPYVSDHLVILLFTYLKINSYFTLGIE